MFGLASFEHKNDRWFFMLGFEKNQRDNIDSQQLKELKKAAKIILSATDIQITLAMKTNEITEI